MSSTIASSGRSLLRSVREFIPRLFKSGISKDALGVEEVVNKATLGVQNAYRVLHPDVASQSSIFRVPASVLSRLLGRYAGETTRAAIARRMVSGRRDLVIDKASMSPLMALIGFAAMGEMVKGGPEEDLDGLHEALQEMLKTKKVLKEESTANEFRGSKLDSFKIGERLGEQTSQAAVYSATIGSHQVAIKMMFNYYAKSDSLSLNRAFAKERSVLSVKAQDDENVGVTSLPPHDNIVKVLHSFADATPTLPDAIESYPSALPMTAHTHGLGHNRTLFLVMPKYSRTLREYLGVNGSTISPRTSTLLLAQLLEGVAHVNEYGIAHRDLKSDNILLDEGVSGCPRLVLTDFGCCLADRHLGLQMPFVTAETDRGGNRTLMAPEVAKAVPGPGVVIDYSKADAWGAGTLAYEIYGQENPFYWTGLDSATYKDSDLPKLQRAHPLVAKVVSRLLKGDVKERITAAQAVNMVNLILWAPMTWLINDWVKDKDIARWLIAQTLDTLIHKRPQETRECLGPVEDEVFLNFLKHTSVEEIKEALQLLHKA